MPPSYKQHVASFFNIRTPHVSEVIGDVHSGHPDGVPFIQTGLQPRQAEPHARGFINSNTNINKAYAATEDPTQFVVSGPDNPAYHNDLRHPQSSPYSIGSNAFRSNIRGGGRGSF